MERDLFNPGDLSVEVLFDSQGEPTFTIKIKQLPIEFADLMESRLKRPLFQTKLVFDQNNEPLSDNSGELITENDLSDPEYREKLLTYNRHLRLAMLDEALDDPGVTFDTPKPDPWSSKEDWATYYDSLEKELADAGMGYGTFKRLIKGLQATLGAKNNDTKRAIEALI